MGHRNLQNIGSCHGRLFLLLFFFSISVFAMSQCDKYSYIAYEDGIIIKEKKFFKNFAILLQDTCNQLNLFQNHHIHYDCLYDSTLLTPIIVDRPLLYKIEDYICSTPPLNTLRKSIRLYIGCIDSNKDTCVIAQFLRKKYYRKDDKFYIRQMYLAVNKPYIMAIFLLKDNNVTLLMHSGILSKKNKLKPTKRKPPEGYGYY